MLRNVASLLLIGLCWPQLSSAQAEVGPNQQNSKTLGNGTQLVEENNYFRVTRQELPAGKSVMVADSSHDLIVIMLSGSDLTIISAGEQGVASLHQGEARFLVRGARTTISSSGSVPAQLVVAALKRHWDADIRECTEPKKCSHPIQTGQAQIGESTLLFTSGFITAYRHRLDRGGTLATSYYSSNGKDHLLLIALTDLQASFDGQEEHLKAGQVYTSDAAQIEVNAGEATATWLLIRMEVPKQPT